MAENEQLSTWARIWIGSSGGIASAIVKYLGQDHSRVSEFFLAGQYTQAINLGLGYAVMVPLLIALGAIVAFFSSDTDKWQLFIKAVAAPALMTTFAGGGGPAAGQTIGAPLAIVSPAYAAEDSVQTSGVSVWKGLKLFFNIEPDRHYRVIVGSFKERNEAERFAEKINAEDSSINAFVGERRPGNEFYPVVASEYVPLGQALAIQQQVLKKQSIADAYLSSYRH